ncbi:RNA polymerase II holoenzyme cyclin-like subunit [Entomophthora muscae]|uniref:RNA polymerase II holoenzyme cyclin-like subunit n=1 Tax=Entomophthora muscae TaxID=34485 RepID=A0ACC2SFQ1_9FUNG|nr:RNA polymerase II holoenzyme cyclin-like subunit [Entomophthora muscae]
MAANYWQSTQLKYWTFEDTAVLPGPSQDLERLPKEDLELIHIYFSLLLSKLGKKLSIRQKHIATAIMFFKRFYTKNSFFNTEPFLVAATAMYLAGKVDEYPYHITNIVNETTAVLRDCEPSIKFPYDTADLADFEFYMLETFHGRITVFHPYHPFSKYIETITIDNAVQQAGWHIINDSFKTDVNLVHAPHMVAIAAIYMSLSLQPEPQEGEKPKPKTKTKSGEKHYQKLAPRDWFAGLNVDLEEIATISQKMMDYYHLHKTRYNSSAALAILKALQDNSPTTPATPSSSGAGTPHQL